MGRPKASQSLKPAPAELPKNIEKLLDPKKGWIYRARKAKRGRKTLVGKWTTDFWQARRDYENLLWPEESASEIPTLRAFMKLILSTVRKDEVAGSTYIREDCHFRTRVARSDLGRMRIDKITDVDCQRFLNDQKYKVKFVLLRGQDGKVIWKEQDGRRFQIGEHVMSTEPLGPGGAKEIAKTLAVYFRKAKSKTYGYIKVSPLIDIEYQRVPTNEEKPILRIEKQDAADLEENLLGFITKLHREGDRFIVMVLTLLDSGIRPGELRALKRSHVAKDAKGQPFLLIQAGRSKTLTGERDAGTKTGRVKQVAIDKETYDRLVNLPRSKMSEYIFFTASGQPVGKRNFNRDFKKFADSVGLPHLTPKGLRHTYISLMLSAGVPLKTVQEQVRHVDPKMIMKVYGEQFSEDAAAAPIKMREMLKDFKTKKRTSQDSVSGVDQSAMPKEKIRPNFRRFPVKHSVILQVRSKES